MEKCIQREEQFKFSKRELKQSIYGFITLYYGLKTAEKRRMNHLILAEIKSHLK